MNSLSIKIIISGLIIGLVVISSCGKGKISNSSLVLLPVPTDPTVSFRIYFKVGSQDDPKGKEGLAYITAQMLADASTLNNSYEQIIAKIFPLAASYNATVSVEMTVLSGRVHKDNLSLYYPLFTDAILRPAFKQEDLDRIKSNVLNELENTLKYANDEELGKAILYNGIFAGTGYGHLPYGTIASVKSITLDDIKNFFNTKYTRNNVVIGLGGGFQDKIAETLKNDLSTLPDAKSESAPVPSPKAIHGLKVTIVEKDANATAFSLGFPISVNRGTKDWYALAIANSWMGEHRNSSSHLYQVIREIRGLNYGNYSYIENFPNGSYLQFPPVNVCRRQQIFEIWIRPVPNETKHFTLRTTMRELQKLVDNGMTQEQFELTRSFLKKYVLHYAPTTTMQLGYAIDDRFYGIQGSHLEMFQKTMDDLTLEAVNAAIKKYLQYKNITVAIITNDAEAFKMALINNSPSPIQYTTPKPKEVLDDDKEIVNYPLEIKPENVKIIEVEDLFL